ncbi:MAG: hypothetical protein RIQ81_1584 [Pseudomonadota bacterium]|jgi:electron transfer flavoprotein alpha subunit
MKVLVFVEQRGGKIKSSAFEALTVGARLAGSPSDAAAVVVGGDGAALAPSLAGYGIDKVYTAGGAGFENYNGLNWAAAVAAAIKDFGPQVVVGVASPMGRDFFPRLAARLDAGLLTDVISVEWKDGALHGTKPMYAGKCRAHLVTQNSPVHLVTIRPNVMPAQKPGSGSATVAALQVSVSGARSKTVEVRKGKSEKADLTEASLIISGGRAMGNAENFKVLNECADVIGATVGASRAAVDSGYATHDMQVGQTGKTVNPNLYIACGISGSIQHMAGMRTSKVIVAVNTDKDAPIFTIANYGIVGDLFQVVPEMTKKLKELVGH